MNKEEEVLNDLIKLLDNKSDVYSDGRLLYELSEILNEYKYREYND